MGHCWPIAISGFYSEVTLSNISVIIKIRLELSLFSMLPIEIASMMPIDGSSIFDRGAVKVLSLDWWGTKSIMTAEGQSLESRGKL